MPTYFNICPPREYVLVGLNGVACLGFIPAIISVATASSADTSCVSTPSTVPYVSFPAAMLWFGIVTLIGGLGLWFDNCLVCMGRQAKVIAQLGEGCFYFKLCILCLFQVAWFVVYTVGLFSDMSQCKADRAAIWNVGVAVFAINLAMLAVASCGFCCLAFALVAGRI